MRTYNKYELGFHAVHWFLYGKFPDKGPYLGPAFLWTRKLWLADLAKKKEERLRNMNIHK